MRILPKFADKRNDIAATDANRYHGDLQKGALVVHTTVVRGKRSWNAHSTGHIVLPIEGDELVLPIRYDERDAPYVPGDQVLVSLADEEDRCACAWATTTDQSLVGLGVDLASPTDFADRPGAKRFIRAIFTKRERELAYDINRHDLPLAYATLFGAKEAAFKATARPLRMWYASHDDPLEFEVRDFCMSEYGLEDGTARHGSAQHALNCMGIDRIEVSFEEADGMALVVARAYHLAY